MMYLVTMALGVGLGLGILACVVWALLRHPELPVWERIGLGLLGAGIVWGGVNRVLGRPVDVGDILLLSGIVLVLWRYFKVHPRIY